MPKFRRNITVSIFRAKVAMLESGGKYIGRGGKAEGMGQSDMLTGLFPSAMQSFDPI
jgi:hypothetical protein